MFAAQVALILLLLLVNTAANAQAPSRVRGTIVAFDGTVLSVTDNGGRNVAPQGGEKDAILFAPANTLPQIKPGDFLGVTSRKGADGALTAYEVRRFPKP